MTILYFNDIIISVFIFSFLFMVSAFAKEVDLYGSQARSVSGTVVGFQKVFEAHNYPESQKNVFAIAERKYKGIWKNDTVRIVSPNGNVGTTFTSVQGKYTEWRLKLEPQGTGAGCRAHGSINPDLN